MNALDYSGYPDCRPEFIAAFEHLATLATARGVHGERFRVHAPLQMMTKADIIRRGIGLGLDYSITHSCYDPGPQERAAGATAASFAPPASPKPASPIPPCLRRRSLQAKAGAEMTERIYYTEPACRSFEAVVTAVTEHEGASAIVLDRTAFYPTSGGQPFDTGRLNTTDVLDTVDDGQRVLHVVRGSLSVGDTVHGEIDWPRRFDHMQQHTGQHVLSAAFDRVLDNRTMSFHMGGEFSTIDLAREVSPADVERCVDEANRVCGRTVRSRSGLPHPKRLPACLCARSPGVRGHCG